MAPGIVERRSATCFSLSRVRERKTFLIVDFRLGFGSFRSVHVPARQRLPCNHLQSILDPQIDSYSIFERNSTLTRIPLVDSNDPATDPLAVEVLKSVSRHRNRTVDPNVYRAMANHPKALRALVDFGTAVYFENSLTPGQRELAYLTASVTNDCHY